MDKDMSLELTYKIDNGDQQTTSAEDKKNKTIFDFFSSIISNHNDFVFIIDGEIIDRQKKINQILKNHQNSLINIYTPQKFKYKDQVEEVSYDQGDIKIADLKQKLKKKFCIKGEIKIEVKNNNELNDILNNEKRSFFKHIKPDLKFIIIKIDDQLIQDNNPKTKARNRSEGSHSKKLINGKENKIPAETTDSTGENKKNPEILKNITKSQSLKLKKPEDLPKSKSLKQKSSQDLPKSKYPKQKDSENQPKTKSLRQKSSENLLKKDSDNQQNSKSSRQKDSDNQQNSQSSRQKDSDNQQNSKSSRQKDSDNQQNSKSSKKKIIEDQHKSRHKAAYKAKYQINKGQIQDISFTEEDGDTIYDVFSKFFDINEKDLVFALFDNSRYICIDSQSKIKDIFPTDSTISIFTPLNFSYKQSNFQFPFQFNYTIEELKIAIKEHLKINEKKKIFFSIRGKKDLYQAFNDDSKHIMKLIQPDMIINVILDEFRFVLIDDVFDEEDKESKVIVQLNSTANDFIKMFKEKNNLEDDGYILCLRFDRGEYILPNTVLSKFKSKDENLPKIQIIIHSIFTIIINKKQYKYFFRSITVKEAKKIIFYNYFTNDQKIKLDDIYLSIKEKGIIGDEEDIKQYQKNILTLQIGYHFNNYKNKVFYFPLETTVKEAKESHKWTYFKIANTNDEIDDSLNLFSSCYGKKINAITEIKLYFNINGHLTSNSFLEHVKFNKIRSMIENDDDLLEKLNTNPNEAIKTKRSKYSKDFIMLFNNKEITDESMVESYQTTRKNPIIVILRPTYKVDFIFNNGKHDRKGFVHGTKISEIIEYFFNEHKRRYKIVANSTVLTNDCLIQDYHDKPLLLRIAQPLYYFFIKGEKKNLELRESITTIEAKLAIMINFLPQITNHHFINLKYEDKIFEDYDILPSYTNIDVDLTPLKSTYIFILPNSSKLYFNLAQQCQNKQTNKIIEIPDFSTFNDVKKIIQEKCQKKEFDVEFYYLNDKIDKKLWISEVKDDEKIKEIEVKFIKKKIAFILNQNNNDNDDNVTTEKRVEFDVYLNEEINSYKDKLLTENVTNIKRITITNKNGQIIENEKFEDLEFESEFYYKIEKDDLFNLFSRRFDQFNNRFHNETKIKEVRRSIERKIQAENVIIQSKNLIYNDDLHLYEINENITIKKNEKEVDDFNIKLADSPFFRNTQTKLNRLLTFTSDSTVGDLRIVLDDILKTDNFSIVLNNSILNDNDEHLFQLGNNFDVVEGIKNGKDQIEPILFETRNRNFIAHLNLNLSFKDTLNILLDKKLLKVSKRNNMNIKFLYEGRFINETEKICDVLNPENKKNQINNNENTVKNSFNQFPIFICFLRKLDNDNIL